MYPRVSWPAFMRQFEWAQGDHILVANPTGGGKTTLMGELLPRRQFVVVFVTKMHDDTFTERYKDYKRIQRWGDIRSVDKTKPNRFLLWPKPGRTTGETIRIQQETFAHAFDRAYTERGWCIVLDELHYMVEMLGLTLSAKLYMHQARSSKLSLVSGTQRPAYIPLVTYSACRHAFIGHTDNADDLKRLGDYGGADRKNFVAAIQRLGEFEYLYVNPRLDRPPVITEVKL